MLKAGLREAAVAGSAQAAALDALGDGSLNSGSDLVTVFPGIGSLFGPGRLNNFVFVAVPQVERAVFGLG